jgi:hypothetical protein
MCDFAVREEFRMEALRWFAEHVVSHGRDDGR